MSNINNTTIYSVFDLIKTAITNNSVLSSKFDSSNIYQYDPKLKSGRLIKFPYIWINVPDNKQDNIILDRKTTIEFFDVRVLIRLEYQARDKTLSYNNAFVKAIKDYETTFNGSGYYDLTINLIDVNPNQVIHSKEIVESEFIINLRGAVSW